jgi:hypothetical protein
MGFCKIALLALAHQLICLAQAIKTSYNISTQTPKQMVSSLHEGMHGFIPKAF